jgi:hypothetical protein
VFAVFAIADVCSSMQIAVLVRRAARAGDQTVTRQPDRTVADAGPNLAKTA